MEQEEVEEEMNGPAMEQEEVSVAKGQRIKAADNSHNFNSIKFFFFSQL
jgi:hypothetical protein